MGNNALIIALAKVLIAAAWADGHLDTEEINIMKDLLFRLQRANNGNSMQYTAVEWAQIEMYIEAPIAPAERARLIDDLRVLMNTPADKQLVLDALDELVRADGVVSPADDAVVAEIRTAINEVDQGFFNQLSRLLTGPRQRRTEALADAPNREKYMDDFLNNKVYYGVRRRQELGEQAPINLTEEQMRRLAALGGVLARVAQVDMEVTDEEFASIVAAMRANWELTEEEALFVAEVSVTEVAPNMDTVRLVRDVYSVVTPDRVDGLMDALFAVAAADGYVSDDEMDAIYSISRALGVAHRQFIDAKLRIPNDKRQS